ncbi:MAG: hypothetical protein WHT46_08220 [Candidatus Geothermincolales bacterium]
MGGQGRKVCKGSGDRSAYVLLCLLLSIACLLFFPVPALAGSVEEGGLSGIVRISDLVENMEEYDGKTVSVEGEVVGDVMIRGEGAWITVNDDPYAERSLEEGGEFAGVSNIGIGVWVDPDMAREIRHTGDYREKGDKVRVSGVFHRACRDHGGETDIHALSLQVLKRGYTFDRPFDWGKLAVALVLLVSTALLWRAREKVRRGRRKRAAW